MPAAYDDGVKLLARRALTRREVASRLAARGHASADVDRAVARLAAAGAVDDADLARRLVASEAQGKGRGRERVLATLAARGIDPSVAAAAWAETVEDGGIDVAAMAARAVRRRLGPPPGRADSSRLARVYNALLDEGFEHDQAAGALAPYGFEGTDP
jgi:regulatory protein